MEAVLESVLELENVEAKVLETIAGTGAETFEWLQTQACIWSPLFPRVQL